jgi:hypothetical protein
MSFLLIAPYFVFPCSFLSEQATFQFNSEDAVLTTALVEAFKKAFN